MNEKQITVKIITDNWNSVLSRVNKLVDSYSDEELELEISPGRNKAKWVLGHLAAVHDFTLQVLGISEMINPELAELFTKGSSNGISDSINTVDVRQYWNSTSQLITSKIKEFTFDELFQKHNSVSEEDFSKEPHRNKLNVILSRTNHLAHHHGQLILLKKQVNA